MLEAGWFVFTIALAFGFVVLVFTGDALVRGSSALALKLGVKPLIVGLTVVAFGTSAPELVVSVQAVLDGVPGLAVGNIVGSNIANVFLVLGLPAIIAPIAAGPRGVRKNALIGLAAAVGFALVAVWLGAITRPLGAVLFVALIAYLSYLVYRARNPHPEDDVTDIVDLDDVEGEGLSPTMIAVNIALGVIGLPIGAALIVHGGVGLGEVFNIDDDVIGLTAVAFGTSLPELAATAIAAYRRRTDLAIGNVLGSNIFNLLAVGGVAAMVGRLPVEPAFAQYDLWVMVFAGVVLLAIPYLRDGAPPAVSAAIGLVMAAVILAFIINATPFTWPAWYMTAPIYLAGAGLIFFGVRDSDSGVNRALGIVFLTLYVVYVTGLLATRTALIAG